MVRGLDRFRDHFRSHAGKYVLIGGAASDLLMDEAGLTFRATKDLDIVLYVEAIDASFVRAFWEFIQLGKYQVQQHSSGRPRFYRFFKPEDEAYPFMLELFSRRPEPLDLPPGSHLTPIPVDEEVSSLSAILLEDDYYEFLHAGTRMIEEIPIVGPERLIPLKARAWLDLTRRQAAGDPIDGKDIAKHKNDIFRLYQIIEPGLDIAIPQAIREDMSAFLNRMSAEHVDLKALGIREPSKEAILDELRKIYVRD